MATLICARIILALLTPVPTRVTISVDDGLHRAIQSARGHFLKEEGIDIPYSAVVEILSRFAVLSFIDADNRVTALSGAQLGKVTDTDRWLLRWSAQAPYADAFYGTKGRGFVDFPDGEFAWEMLPHLLKAAKVDMEKAHPELLKFRLERDRRKARGHRRRQRIGRDAPVAQSESTAFGKAEDRDSFPAGALPDKGA